jgi:hypothetical protein
MAGYSLKLIENAGRLNVFQTACVFFVGGFAGMALTYACISLLPMLKCIVS